MATTSRTLTANKYGWVDGDMPDTVFAVGTSWMKIDGSDKLFYFGTPAFPSAENAREAN